MSSAVSLHGGRETVGSILCRNYARTHEYICVCVDSSYLVACIVGLRWTKDEREGVYMKHVERKT